MTAREPSLTLVSDRRRLPGGDLPGLAGAAARAGVDWIQVREKDLADRELARLAGAVMRAVEGTPARVLVNGRPDVADVAGADGVQLPEDGLPVSEVKRSFPRLVVGASRHSLEGARRAEAEGADFVLLGPVFATPGKESRCWDSSGWPRPPACCVSRSTRSAASARRRRGPRARRGRAACR